MTTGRSGACLIMLPAREGVTSCTNEIVDIERQPDVHFVVVAAVEGEAVGFRKVEDREM